MLFILNPGIFCPIGRNNNINMRISPTRVETAEPVKPNSGIRNRFKIRINAMQMMALILIILCFPSAPRVVYSIEVMNLIGMTQMSNWSTGIDEENPVPNTDKMTLSAANVTHIATGRVRMKQNLVNFSNVIFKDPVNDVDILDIAGNIAAVTDWLANRKGVSR